MTVVDDAGSFNPAMMKGFASYSLFAESAKANLRYLRDQASENFLNDLLTGCVNRKLVIPKGSFYWRARLGREQKLVTNEYDDISVSWLEDLPYSQDGMKPIPNWQSEGRANPRGIPYLYLATTRDTALAEVRPWIGSLISVVQFKIERDLNVIDCSKHHSKKLLRTLARDKTLSRDDGIWIALDRAFATPVTSNDEGGEYIPTQIIAELFKCNGFDGIRYKSLLSEDGYNVALFKVDDASAVNPITLYTADSIGFDFQPYGRGST
ncbi:MAG: RES family NAD+ phosphorylase [Rhodomicrobium sp.]